MYKVSVLGTALILFFLGGVVEAKGPKSSLPASAEPPHEENLQFPQVKDPLLLVVNLPAARLDLYQQDQLLKSYPVAIGTHRYPTPIRDYNISMVIWNPWWIPPDSEWAKDAEKTPPGRGNPLGVVKLVMEKGIRIHGTNNARSIGRASSHACLRMHNKDARELAWEIQQRYSEKTDPALLDKYRRYRRSSFYVKLFEPVPVRVLYRQVERKKDRLILHPNRYWRRGFQDELEDALWDHPEILIDKPLVQKLDKMRRRKTVEVPLSQVMAWARPYTPTVGNNPASAEEPPHS